MKRKHCVRPLSQMDRLRLREASQPVAEVGVGIQEVKAGEQAWWGFGESTQKDRAVGLERE